MPGPRPVCPCCTFPFLAQSWSTYEMTQEQSHQPSKLASGRISGVCLPCEISLHVVLSSLISHNFGCPNAIFTSPKSIVWKNLWIVSHCTLHRSGFKFGPVFRQVTVSWLLWAKPSWSKHLKLTYINPQLATRLNRKERLNKICTHCLR